MKRATVKLWYKSAATSEGSGHVQSPCSSTQHSPAARDRRRAAAPPANCAGDMKVAMPISEIN